MGARRVLGVSAFAALVLSACHGGRDPATASGSAGEAPAVMSDAAWRAHCEAVSRRNVSCVFATEARDLALCVKTQPCVNATHRPEAARAIYACEEKGACDDDCDAVAGRALQPSDAERAATTACTTKLPGCGLCQGYMSTVPVADEESGGSDVRMAARTLPDEHWDTLRQCIETEARSCGDVQTCTMAGLAGAVSALGCLAKYAPEETQAGMTATPQAPLPERPAVDAFAKIFSIALGDPRPEARAPAPAPARGRSRAKVPSGAAPAAPAPPQTWSYADLDLLVYYEYGDPNGTGPLRRISAAADGTDAQCRAVFQALIADYGPPSTARKTLFGVERIWRGRTGVLVAQRSSKRCEIDFAAPGTWQWNSAMGKD